MRTGSLLLGGLLLVMRLGAALAAVPDAAEPPNHPVPDVAADSGDDTFPWRLVAQSDLIVRARIIVPDNTVKALSAGRTDNLAFGLAVAEAFNADRPGAVIQLKVATAPADNGPGATHVVAYQDKEAILFLSHPYSAGSDAYYFAGHTTRALAAATPEVVDALRREVRAQAELAHRATDRLSREILADDEAVAKLIGMARLPATMKVGVDGLMALSSDAIPALIRRMDDRRSVTVLSSLISPDAAEPGGVPPRTVVLATVDLIAIVLERLTRQSFGDLHRGGTEEERRRVVTAWKVWLGRSAGW
jgi:hypothetical protein